jgi:hypothetical protein
MAAGADRPPYLQESASFVKIRGCHFCVRVGESRRQAEVRADRKMMDRKTGT